MQSFMSGQILVIRCHFLMVRSTLLGVGSLRLERLQPMGQIWQNQDYNKRVFFWLCKPNISVILTSGVRIGASPMPRNCMNLVLRQTIVPEVEKLMFNCNFWSGWEIMRNWKHQKSFRHIHMTFRSHCMCPRMILDGRRSSMLIFRIVKNVWFS